MRASFYDPGFTSNMVRDECPVCRGTIVLSLVEPHLVRAGWEIYTYTCKTCGPIKSRIVASPSNRATKPQAA